MYFSASFDTLHPKPQSAEQFNAELQSEQNHLKIESSDVQRILQRSQIALRNLRDHPQSTAFPVERSKVNAGQWINAGGFGQIRDVEIAGHYQDRKIVIKSIKANADANSNEDKHKNLIKAVRSLFIESNVLDALRHEHIIDIRAWAEEGLMGMLTGKCFFIVLDKVDETVSDRIDQWRSGQKNFLNKLIKKIFMLGEPQELFNQQIRIAAELANAISYLHERNIIHRDIKPSNVGLLKGKVKLLDFGLSRKLPTDSNQASFSSYRMSLVGSKDYMAPEVQQFKPYSNAADVFSWACFFFDLLTLGSVGSSQTLDEAWDKIPISKSKHTTEAIANFVDDCKVIVSESTDISPEHRPRIKNIYEYLSDYVNHFQIKPGSYFK